MTRKRFQQLSPDYDEDSVGTRSTAQDASSKRQNTFFEILCDIVTTELGTVDFETSKIDPIQNSIQFTKYCGMTVTVSSN
jgi:hypothetical protein